ncbi:hypothetical protein DFH08DRAFT_860605 [Mycena albidolilacea]|uniref:Uncharacterized protein n=1 Tax=Mycena albidolilacea TaxID=1033008 RepID=A0AAD7ETU6_9AGAR|nr:hypothetical protein DFH08DRAFT_860605 [Mycena albidolilacea]
MSCRGARMMQDGETHGLRASIFLSTVHLKTSRSSREGAARARGRGRAAAAPREDDAEGETRYCVRIQPLVLSGSISLSRDDWQNLRRDKHYGTTTIPDLYPNTPLPHHCAAFPFRCGCAASTHILDLPLLRLPAPYLHTRSLPPTVSAAWAPAIPRMVIAFRIQNMDEAQMDREMWDGSVCVQALARRDGRSRKKIGVGRGAVEAGGTLRCRAA